MREYRLLLVEDTEDDALLLERFLRRQGMEFSLRRAVDFPTFKELFLSASWDAILCDFQFPGANALDVLPWVRAQDPHVPFLVVSGKVGEELAVAVMRGGANDFLVKGQLARLAPAIEREVRDADIRRQHRKLDQERTTLHLAVSQMPDGLVITDHAGTIQYANPAMEAISGYELTELIGKNPRIFKSGNQNDLFYRRLWETLSSGRQWRGTFINRKKNGDFWYSEALIAPVIGPDQRISHYICTNRDITAQRSMEARLQESQRLEALGLLTAGVAHDFNNLLMPILVHAEMGLRRGDTTSREMDQFRSILKQVDRAKSLIRQLVGYSRGGQDPLEPMPLHGFLEETLALLRAAIPSEHRLESNLEAGEVAILCAPTRLQQVLLNLCANAMQAMLGRAGTIRIGLRLVTMEATLCAMDDLLPAGPYALIEVSDTGTGIPPDLIDKIFLPFVTTKPREQGTGLGLSIVLGLVREMQGGIQVESGQGEGTTFRLFLPVYQGKARPARIPAPEVPVSRPLTLLMVDDDTVVVTVTSRALRELGHRVRAVRTPSRGMLWFREHVEAPDAVILDYAMPECSGLELLTEMRKLRPELPALIVSGNLEQVDQERAESLGVGLLQKPVPTQELILALAAILPAEGSAG